MEIGLPTDVKHVAHIGWDGPSGSAPTWMNEFKTSSDFTATSIGNIIETIDHSSSAMPTCSSQVCEFKRTPPAADLPDAPKKNKRKKKNLSSSSLRSSRAANRSLGMSKTSACRPADVQVV